MQGRHQVRILHLSTYTRVSPSTGWMKRKKLIQMQKYMRERMLGDPLVRVLREITQERRVDLLCFTGDIADWGLAAEYQRASLDFTR